LPIPSFINNQESNVKYRSTRDSGNIPDKKSFLEILLGGLAPDGGLYMPEHYPQFSYEDLEFMRDRSYRSNASMILSRLADDIDPTDLRALINRTYTAEAFSHGRPDSDFSQISPVRKLEDGLFILELSNGPTLAFKDMAMQLLGNLFEYALDQAGQDINILGATSGDTGSAAEYALRGKKNVRVFMLSPEEGMTRFQQAQMYSLQDDNIFNIAIRGTFDDCQAIVKAVSNDAAFKAEYRIGAVNSINWARIAAQVVYYFKAYFAVTTEVGQPVDFCVPSGNFGDVCAGHVARMMGLPIRKLIVATNENDVLDEFFRTGVYRPRKSADVAHTDCPSMDISVASNLERVVFDAVGRDGFVLGHIFALLDTSKRDMPGWFDLSRYPEAFRRLKEFGFVSGSSSHTERMEAIRLAWRKYGVMIDTHTVAGLAVGMRCREEGVPLVCLETALPAKFENVMVEALGRKPERPASLAGLEDLPQRVVHMMDPVVDDVKAFIAEHCPA
jgi:threonine synthase